MIIVQPYNQDVDMSLLGGKGQSLYLMIHAGYKVPEFFILTNKAYEMWLLQNDIELKTGALFNGISTSNDTKREHTTKKVAKYLKTTLIPEPIQSNIINAFVSTFSKGEPVAVRSSANLEDSRSLTFAGIFQTFLNVRTIAEVLESVRDCFASVFSGRAISYFTQNGKTIQDIKMSVVIQKMIPSEISGILLTADAINRRQYIATIDAIWGVGEAIVQGLVTPDTYVVNRHTLKIEKSDIKEKSRLLICDPLKSGLETAKVPSELSYVSTLTDSQISRLVSIGQELERQFGYFQDVEWAIYKEEIYLLQSRPLAGSLMYRKEF